MSFTWMEDGSAMGDMTRAGEEVGIVISSDVEESDAD